MWMQIHLLVSGKLTAFGGKFISETKVSASREIQKYIFGFIARNEIFLDEEENLKTDHNFFEI